MRRLRFRHVSTSAVLALASSIFGCSFHPPPTDCVGRSLDKLDSCLNEFPVSDPYAAGRNVVYEVAGKIQVQHGRSCARPSGNNAMVWMHDSAPFPSGLDQGTVIFNGWLTGYEQDDHHVRGLGGAIVDVKVVTSSARVAGTAFAPAALLVAPSKTLEWNAAGTLTDNWGHPFDWCYLFTTVFWNSAAIDASVLAAYPFRALLDPAAQGPEHTIAGAFADKRIGNMRALLPRGFGADFTDDDHHVLQADFDLGMPAPSPDGTGLTWRSKVLLKDNDTSRPYESLEFFELMAGTGVNMFQPTVLSHFNPKPPAHWEELPNNFHLQPKDPASSCVTDSIDLVRNDYCVQVPFSYAVPMLTGWGIENECDDSHVSQIGAYIDHFSYTAHPDLATATSGTLCYQVVTSLSDNSGGRQANVALDTDVTILGLSPAPTLGGILQGGGGGVLK